jgi:hypothetical protein
VRLVRDDREEREEIGDAMLDRSLRVSRVVNSDRGRISGFLYSSRIKITRCFRLGKYFAMTGRECMTVLGEDEIVSSNILRKPVGCVNFVFNLSKPSGGIAPSIP